MQLLASSWSLFCDVQELQERVQALEEALQLEKAARYHVQQQIEALKQNNRAPETNQKYNILTCE
jgi:hypothetical protein